MEALAVMMIGAVLGLLAGGARASLRSRGSGQPAESVLRDLVAEHLGLARDRLGAAEARIALLEERLAFHDGFLRVTPLDGGVPVDSLPVRVERVARARQSQRAAKAGDPRADPGILQFPSASDAAEETPNPSR